MEYKKLSDFADFREERTANITFDNYISTENMIKDKCGITTASSLPNVKTTSLYKPNDILLSNIRPYFRKIWFATKSGSCSNDVLVVKAKNNILPLFLYYVLSDNNFFNYDTVTSKGTKMPRGTPRAIMKYLIPDITPDKQEKIASILSSYDNLIENNNKRIKLLEQMAENFYKEWFVRFRFPGYENTKFENGIPKGWEVFKIKNIIKRLPFNRTYKQDELENSGKVIVIDQSTDEFSGYHNNEPSHCADYDNPIILFGDHSCKFVFMVKNFSLGENVVPFVSINPSEINNYYLFYAVHKLIITEEYKRHWSRFTAMKILKPNIELQTKFADFVKPLINEKEIIWLQNQNLIKQRDILLPRLMSGKLEV